MIRSNNRPTSRPISANTASSPTWAEAGEADAYRAYHPELGRTVILKHLREGVSRTANRDLLLREGQVLASLPAHPNLVQILDLDTHDGRVFLVLEDVQGRTLDQYAAERPSPWKAAAWWPPSPEGWRKPTAEASHTRISSRATF